MSEQFHTVDVNLGADAGIERKKNGIKIAKTVSHLQNANDTGGTYSTPPLATIIFDAIKIG